MTGWMGENGFQALPVALYGVVLLLCGFSFVLLTRLLVRDHGKDSMLAKSIRSPGGIRRVNQEMAPLVGAEDQAADEQTGGAVRQPKRPALPDEGLRLHQGLHALLEEQRVPLRPGDEGALERVQARGRPQQAGEEIVGALGR